MARSAVEQRNAQLLLQLGDCTTNGRGSDLERRGRLGETAGVDCADKQFKASNTVHGLSSATHEFYTTHKCLDRYRHRGAYGLASELLAIRSRKKGNQVAGRVSLVLIAAAVLALAAVSSHG